MEYIRNTISWFFGSGTTNEVKVEPKEKDFRSLKQKEQLNYNTSVEVFKVEPLENPVDRSFLSLKQKQHLEKY